MATDSAGEILLNAFDKFSMTLREAGRRAGDVARMFGVALDRMGYHSLEAHEVISDELTACVLGARKRPELEGDFAEDLV